MECQGLGHDTLRGLEGIPLEALKVNLPGDLDLLHREHDRLVLASYIQLAHQLGLKIMVDGVPDREHLSVLAKAGCDLALGPAISQPLGAGQVGDWLKEWNGRQQAVRLVSG